MTKTNKKQPGRKALYRGKVRKPVSITLPPAHHRLVNARTHDLGITRADFIALLIEKYGPFVAVDPVGPSAYKRLRMAVEVLGGTLEHHKKGEPQGGTWVLTLGGKRLPMESKQSMQYRNLDDCYRLKAGIAESRTWHDHEDIIEPGGLAKLFKRLADSEGSGSA